MQKIKVCPAIQAIFAAVLFGASAPLSKVLLESMEPVPLAAFLYLGSGLGLFLFQVIQRITVRQKSTEAPLEKKDIPWLLGAILFGGVIAPIILMTSLQITPASTASLLLNFEGVATTMIAMLVFKENVGRRVGLAVVLIALSSILLSWDFSNQWGISIGALGVISACVCWGIDNNLTRGISSKNPFMIVTIKGIGAGLFSLVLSLLIKSLMPDLGNAAVAMLLGFFSYGLSIVLFVLAMRNMGSTRTSAFFGTAPFIGTIFSFLLVQSLPDAMFILALPIMAAGTILLLKDKHVHTHLHEAVVHEHRHTHNDGHHDHMHTYNDGHHDHMHTHNDGHHDHMHTYNDGHHDHSHEDLDPSTATYHSHKHQHELLEHTHDHMPDTHHRHDHSQ